MLLLMIAAHVMVRVNMIIWAHQVHAVGLDIDTCADRSPLGVSLSLTTPQDTNRIRQRLTALE
jgi:hypothetical protein